MPQPNDYLFDIKHRLVGAAVLIVAAIVILPIVLTGQNQGHRHVYVGNGDAVMPIKQTFISRVKINSSESSVERSPTDIVKGESKVKEQPDKEQPSKDFEKQRVDGKQQMTNSSGLSSGWVVRVGVFQISENANKRKSLLAENGFRVKLEEAKLDGKAAVRVFLGPFASEEEADRIKAQAIMLTNDKAFVARYP